MKRNPFPVESSVVCRQALTHRVLGRYDLVPPVSCHFTHRGFNDTYTVLTGKETFYLRVYSWNWRTRSQIEAEVEMLHFLSKREHPVSGPVKRRDGAFLTRLIAPEGTRYAVLFTEAPGKVPPADLSRSQKCGTILAGIHANLDQRRIDKRRYNIDLAYLLEQPLDRLKPLLEHREGDFDYLKEVAQRLSDQIGGLLPKSAPYFGCCHGDLGFIDGGNVHEDEEGNMTLFDFDFYGYGWRAYDVSVFLWNRILEFGWSKTGRARTTRRWNAFLRGYAEVRTLEERELIGARLFVPVRHIFAMGVHAEGSGGFLSDEYFNAAINFVRESLKYYAPDIHSGK